MHLFIYPLNVLDYPVTEFLNRFAQKSYLVDMLNSGFEGEPLLKGGVVVAFVWWAWFRRSSRQDRDRAYLIAGVVASALAIVFARLLALSLPFRVRPRFTPELHFLTPFGSDDYTLLNWSSFPSDHAALFFALATAIFLVSRRAGLICFTYVAVFICVPRIYLGTHFLSDLLVGGLIGIAATATLSKERIRTALARTPLRWIRETPGRFYSIAYLFSFLITTNYDVARKTGSVLLHALHAIHHAT
jgi:undecaprenyl-diphosphatase